MGGGFKFLLLTWMMIAVIILLLGIFLGRDAAGPNKLLENCYFAAAACASWFVVFWVGQIAGALVRWLK